MMPVDKQQARASLIQLSKDKQSLLVKEADLSSQLENVRASIQDVIQRAAAIINSLSPISRLPTETLTTILALNQHNDDDQWAKVGWEAMIHGYPVPSVIVASHVNRRFREVAISVPNLWTNINFSAKTSPDLLETYLARSQRCLLDIKARDIGDRYPIHLFHDPLIRNIHRWRTYSAFNVCYESTRSFASSLSDLMAPCLESLVLYDFREGLSPVAERCRILTGGAPRLREVIFMRSSIFWFRPPMASLTTLVVGVDGGISYAEFRELLTSAPRLVDLHFTHYVKASPLPGHLAPIDLPSLERLHVRVFSLAIEDRIRNLLPHLAIPNLDCLSIDMEPDRDPDDPPEDCAEDIEIVISFLTTNAHSSYPRLHQISFAHLDLYGLVTLEFLHALPEIRIAKLYRGSVSPILAALFNHDVNEMPPWPNLESLTIHTNETITLRNLMASRSAFGRRLRAMNLIRWKDSGNVAWLREHVGPIGAIDSLA